MPGLPPVCLSLAAARIRPVPHPAVLVLHLRRQALAPGMGVWRRWPVRDPVQALQPVAGRPAPASRVRAWAPARLAAAFRSLAPVASVYRWRGRARDKLEPVYRLLGLVPGKAAPVGSPVRVAAFSRPGRIRSRRFGLTSPSRPRPDLSSRLSLLPASH